MSDKVLTKKFRASYANVFKPSAMNEGDEAKYGIVMLFPKETDISELKTLALSAVTAKWGSDKTKWPKKLRLPWRDGDEERSDTEGYPGHTFIAARSKQKPGIIDQAKNPIESEDEFYSGCYARATVTAYAYDTKGNQGAAFGLQNLQKMADGEPFSGRSKAEDDFGPVEDAPAMAGASKEVDPFA